MTIIFQKKISHNISTFFSFASPTWLIPTLFVMAVGLLSATLAAQSSDLLPSSHRASEPSWHQQSWTGTPQPIVWHSDLETAKKLAAEQNKLVLLHFTAEWCRPCDALETFVYVNLQVQRSFSTNVVALKIDVDERPDLVKEYGVTGVPFDIALTPAGRIVSKRSSPRDALVYNDMLQSFNKTIQALAGGENVALNQNLDELKVKLAANHQVVQQKPLAPQAPSHAGPRPSYESSELHRNSTVANPFTQSLAQATANATLIIPKPEPNPIGPRDELANRNSVSGTATSPQQNQVQPKRVLNRRFFVDDEQDHAITKTAKPAPEVQPSLVGQQNLNNNPRIESLNPASLDAAAAQFKQTKPSNAVNDLLISQTDPTDYALHGKCPVTLLKEGRWEDGDPQWGCTHRQRTYVFSSAANLAEFQSDPDAWSPLLAGHDPVIFERTGELVCGEEAHGVFMGKVPNQRVVLFSTPETRAEFQSNPRKYIETIRQAMQSSGGSSSTLMR